MYDNLVDDVCRLPSLQFYALESKVSPCHVRDLLERQERAETREAATRSRRKREGSGGLLRALG
jgi:hypothetical protein